MPVKKGLGRGLGSLLGSDAVDAVDNESVDVSELTASKPSASAPLAVDTNTENGLVARFVRIIDVNPNPEQPRKTFEEEPLRTLADSIERHGVLQPIAVRALDGGGYIIIAGERRWRAARIAGLSEIPAVIVNADERAAAELALIENLQREDLNPVEEAEGLKKLAEGYNLTDAEVGERVGKSRSAVANALRLLSLEQPVLDMLAAGEITAGHARALITLPPTVQMTLAEKIVSDDLSVRKVEELVKKTQEEYSRKQNEPSSSAKSKNATVDYYSELGENMSSRMTRKVTIERGKGKKSRGWIHIEYYSDDDLDYIAGAILGVRDRDWV